MEKIKEMPYEEKYATVIDNMKFEETFILPLVQKHLGDSAVAELKRTWQEGAKPIPEGGSFEQKYEMAYGNWIWMAKSAYSLIRKKMGEEGIKKFERAEVEALKRKNTGPALFLLGFLRLFSPGLAFTMTTRKMAYQLQWITPSSVSELTKQRAVFNIPHCKILDFPETEDLCLVGCQSAYPMWVAKQFKAKMEFKRQGNSCTCTLTPLQ
jgi:hypothetical protein